MVVERAGGSLSRYQVDQHLKFIIKVLIKGTMGAAGGTRNETYPLERLKREVLCVENVGGEGVDMPPSPVVGCEVHWVGYVYGYSGLYDVVVVWSLDYVTV